MTLMRFLHALALISIAYSSLLTTAKHLRPISGDSQSAIYSLGLLAVEFFEIDASEEGGPAADLLVATPIEPGKYPLVQFHTAWLLDANYYRGLFQNVASHGFIVVAPQLYNNWWWASKYQDNATSEMRTAAAVADWLRVGLVAAFPQELAGTVVPEWTKVAIAGHGRGGKIAFGLAQGLVASSQRFGVIATVDPVDGFAPSIFSHKGYQTAPPILTGRNHSFGLPFPTLIIGSGLGGANLGGLIAPCAPKSLSHELFFAESSAPAYHFVAQDSGFMDVLDDDVTSLATMWCVDGISRAGYRKLVGGLFVTFLRAELEGDGTGLKEAVRRPDLAPVHLQKPEVYVEKQGDRL